MPPINWQKATRSRKLREMKQGQSFAIDPEERNKWLAAGYQVKDAKFATRTLENGETRIWRTV